MSTPIFELNNVCKNHPIHHDRAQREILTNVNLPVASWVQKLTTQPIMHSPKPGSQQHSATTQITIHSDSGHHIKPRKSHVVALDVPLSAFGMLAKCRAKNSLACHKVITAQHDHAIRPIQTARQSICNQI